MSDYVVYGWKWTDYTVTWAYYGDLAYYDEIVAAVDAWDDVIAIDFVEVSYTSNPDIYIHFGYIDGSYSTLGETTTTYYPSTLEIVDADILLDSGEVWNWNGNEHTLGSGTTFYEVVTHEIGHAIGLGHPTNSDTLMYSNADGSASGLTYWDIYAAQSLYGGEYSWTYGWYTDWAYGWWADWSYGGHYDWYYGWYSGWELGWDYSWYFGWHTDWSFGWSQQWAFGSHYDWNFGWSYGWQVGWYLDSSWNQGWIYGWHTGWSLGWALEQDYGWYDYWSYGWSVIWDYGWDGYWSYGWHTEWSYGWNAVWDYGWDATWNYGWYSYWNYGWHLG